MNGVCLLFDLLEAGKVPLTASFISSATRR